MKGIWLLRHGDVNIVPKRTFVGQRDVRLSSVGRLQYERLAAELVALLEKTPPVAILCSDLSRSIECADSIRRAFRPRGGEMPIIANPGLREVSLGAWEGLSKEDVEKRYPGALEERGADFAGYAPIGGESFEMVQRRALLALLQARIKYPDGILVLVGHAGLNKTILADYLALPLKELMRIPQPFACSTYLENR